MQREPDDAELRQILAGARTIAVVGIKERPEEDANRVPRYMQARGYRIVPVNPGLREALGERAFPTLRHVDTPVDLVNLFRAPAHVPAHAEEVLALEVRPSAVWLQLGIRCDEAAERLEAAGIRVVQDRCLMVEHARLFGSGA